MKHIIEFINDHSNLIETVGCCCGHKIYSMTIIVKHNDGTIYDLISNKVIPRKKKFYKRDNWGYYYIPEVDNERT